MNSNDGFARWLVKDVEVQRMYGFMGLKIESWTQCVMRFVSAQRDKFMEIEYSIEHGVRGIVFVWGTYRVAHTIGIWSYYPVSNELLKMKLAAPTAMAEVFTCMRKALFQMAFEYEVVLRKKVENERPTYDRLVGISTFMLCWARYKWSGMPREIMRKIIGYI